MEEPPDRQTGHTLALPAGMVLIAGAVLALHCRYYMPFLADDALICLRYAQRLLHGHGLTWTEGQPVEGYSNLLWILLAAGMGHLGVDLVTGLRLLGGVCSGMLIGALCYGYWPQSLGGWLPLSVALLTVVLAGPVAIWTIGGLETMLMAALLAWALVLLQQALSNQGHSAGQVFLASIPLALLCITRPDGALLATAAALGMMLAEGLHRPAVRTVLLLGALPAGFYLGQLVFRLAYYGQWVPNTAYVKLSPSLPHLGRGVVYLFWGLVSLCPLSVLALGASVGMLLQRRDEVTRRRITLLAVAAVAWASYVAVIGGDTFPGWRHLVPLIVLMALALALAAQWCTGRWPTARRSLVLLLLGGAFAGYGLLQWYDQENHRAVTERWEWDGKVVGEMLKLGFGDRRPLLACTACGCLPFWSELPAIDMLGLNDHHIARHRPSQFGHGTLGHELGDGLYVWQRRPDLVIFAGARGREKAYFLSGVQLQSQPEFPRTYSLVRFRHQTEGASTPVESLIWVRRTSQKVGIQRSPTKVLIPGYLFNGNRQTVAYLDRQQRFVVGVWRGQPAVAERLGLPCGRWRVEVEGSAELQVRICRSRTGEALLDDLAPACFLHEGLGEAPVDIRLSTESRQPVQVRRVRLVRLPLVSFRSAGPWHPTLSDKCNAGSVLACTYPLRVGSLGQLRLGFSDGR